MGHALLKLMGPWGAPPDGAAWAALVLGVLLLAAAALFPAALRDSLMRQPSRRFVAGAAIAATLLSLLYVDHYLHGGPRIVDATAYYLQGRALSHGRLAWAVPTPSASFRGRFLLFHDGVMAGIFPPGYPLLLAAGFLVGAPMVVGPVLAAALVVATWALARELGHGLPEPDRELAARGAVLLSVVCGALRYHTADTMSHGAAALGVVVALVAALRARRTGATRPWLLAGLAVGYVAATRPASALPIGACVGWLARSDLRRATPRLVAAALPGLALLLQAQHLGTGHWLASTQRAYYAVSDGPPGCFRYGFGAGVGCLHEHGDFVRAHLQHGYGLVAAIGTTARRLHLHVSDALNAWPVLLLALPALVHEVRARPVARVAFALVGLQILAYAPFYFDGDYPGGGARFYADVLPVEHALLAVALVAWLPRVALARKLGALLGLACAGFALHAAFGHLALASREGGRPMFEPERLAEHHVDHGLLFVDTDHGFDLAHDPEARPTEGLVVARLHHDDHDRLVYDRLGEPPTSAYRYGDGVVTLLPFVPPAATDNLGYEQWRFEAESDWPPLAQQGAWAEPTWAAGTCVSGGQALTVMPAGAHPGTVTIALPSPHHGRFLVTPRVWLQNTHGRGSARIYAGTEDLARWSWVDDGPAGTCLDLPPREVTLPPRDLPFELGAQGAPVALDRTVLRPIGPR